MRKTMLVSALALCGLSCVAASVTSRPMTVVIDPSADFLWGTLPNASCDTKWAFPTGATKARLSVSAPGFSYQGEDTTATSASLDMIPAASVAERAYDLTLAFDNGVAWTARVARVTSAGASSATCSVLNVAATDRLWKRVSCGEVRLLPVPTEADALTVNGTALPLDAFCRWCNWTPNGGPYLLASGGESASLEDVPGCILFIR